MDSLQIQEGEFFRQQLVAYRGVVELTPQSFQNHSDHLVVVKRHIQGSISVGQFRYSAGLSLPRRRNPRQQRLIRVDLQSIGGNESEIGY